MRFAFKTAPQNTTWADMLAVWREADDIEPVRVGLDLRPLLPDLLRTPPGPAWRAGSRSTALAQATTRLRLGTLVTGIVYRHPAVLANMAATLDIISGGRLELGLGAGWNEEECGAYGIELGSLRERFDRFDEACEVSSACWPRRPRTTPAATTADRRPVRAEAGAASASAARHRRRRREADAADGGPPGPALEPADGRDPRRVRAEARRAGRALRRHRPRPGRDHGLHPHAAAIGRRSDTWPTRRRAG